MADERVDSEIVSQFLLNTCRLRPQLNDHAVQAAGRCARLVTLHLDDDVEADFIPLITGSVAEFYIEPMLPNSVGDVDVMHHCSNELAIPRGHTPPAHLPAEFHNYINVMEIFESHYPGYVYLEARYLLTYCPEDEKYHYVELELDERGIISISSSDIDQSRPMVRHGPALFNDNRGNLVLSVDVVYCYRCLVWPPQAADWPGRQRNYGWPESATVEHVVGNGCDIVQVAHRQCRQHELLGKYQWRLSFSRAEIVLINSWMSVQQIVYHMLRVFVKIEGLTESVDNSDAATLSNYHIKTLMFWACELKPNSWWADSLNLVKICVELLHTLSVWLTERRCQHYFINDCNLMDDDIINMQTIVIKLMSTNEARLSSWFVKNYIDICAERCPFVVSGMKLQNVVSAVVDWRLAMSVIDLYDACCHAEFLIQTVSNSFGTLRSCVYANNMFAKMGAHLTVYFTAVAFLDVARRISSKGFSDELMDILTALLGYDVDIPRYSYQRSSVLFLNAAAKLMNTVAYKFVDTMQLVEIHLWKAYLQRALRCRDSDSDSIYCLANVYLTVLYYTTGQYQTAIYHCTLVTRSQDHSQCSSHVVQGELLPKVDDDIDSALGLSVFYQYLLSAALNQQQRQYCSVFTTELFAYYLNIKLMSVTNFTRLIGIFQRYLKCMYEIRQFFAGDILVFKLLKFSFDQNICSELHVGNCNRFVTCVTKLDTSELVELLQKSAVKHLTTCRQLEAQQFGSVVTIVTTDYEALYAYKRGDYQRCLLLSTQNVHTLLCAVHIPPVVTHAVFIQLLDDDIVSMTALMLIVNPKCRQEPRNVSVTQLTLSLYLMTQCQLKLRRSLTSLALTLNSFKHAQRRIPRDHTLARLTLHLALRKIEICDLLNHSE